MPPPTVSWCQRHYVFVIHVCIHPSVCQFVMLCLMIPLYLQLRARSVTPKRQLSTRRSVWWSTVSKAALRPSNTRAQTSPSSTAWIISSWTAIMAVSVEWCALSPVCIDGFCGCLKVLQKSLILIPQKQWPPCGFHWWTKLLFYLPADFARGCCSTHQIFTSNSSIQSYSDLRYTRQK